MLIEPPNRGSMWRFGFSTPRDFNDNEQFCGGYGIQWQQNDGKCGQCGDNWQLPRPRPHENGGVYGTGTIAKTYKAGEVVRVEAKITANHRGYFEFRLCPLKEKMETDECFDQYLLQQADGSGTKYYLPEFVPGYYSTNLQLPKGLTCSQCVLQWTYTTGNTWGKCDNGTTALGCGPQETFRTCSDIAIE
ncbi:uncharacterized protein [Anabrus simplex]|uniref:uncharacterized protein n=1 Tax=Anabrus simplex TaxID=316456 RepID=UPI0035A2BEFE